MTPNPAPTRLFLVRHCDVRNPEGVLYGHLPGFPLSEKGRVQAEALALFFESREIRRICSSPLERARQTATIIAAHLGGLPVTVSEDLVEARFGYYLQGVKPRDVPWRRPLWLVHMAWPGLLRRDESVAAMAARVRRPLTEMLREAPGESGLFVSHGDPIQAFWVEAEHRPRYALHRLQCAKGGMLELEYDGEALRSLSYRSPASIGEPQSSADPIPT